MIRYTAAQVAAAVGAGHLDANDAETLSETEYGAYDVAVDGAGNVFFNGNHYDPDTWTTDNYVGLWNGTPGEAMNYDRIATTAGGLGNWYTFLDAIGHDVTAGAGASLYCGDFYEPGLGVLVPEPGTAAILAAGMLAALRRRRRRG